MRLTPVDRVEIMVLMDNMADYLLAASEHVVRPPLSKEAAFLGEPSSSTVVRSDRGETTAGDRRSPKALPSQKPTSPAIKDDLRLR